MRVQVSDKLHCEKLKSGGYWTTRRIRFQTGILGQTCRIFDKRSGKLVLSLDADGWLTIEPGYKWDGASFIVIDRKANMRAGLLHDALYQLLRSGLLGQQYREPADALYRAMYLDDADDVKSLPESASWIKRKLRGLGKGINNAAAQVVGAFDYGGLRVGAAHAAAPQREVEAVELVFP